MMGEKPRGGTDERGSSSARDLLPSLLACALALCVMAAAFGASTIHPHSAWKLAAKMLWKNASFRPPTLLALTVIGWAWVVRVCRGAGMSVDFVGGRG